MKKRKKDDRARRPKNRLRGYKRSMVMISSMILLLGGMVLVQGISLRERNEKYKAQEMELEAQIEDEKDRSAEIDELKEYVGTDQYIEDVAREKLGLVHENEILFRAEQ